MAGDPRDISTGHPGRYRARAATGARDLDRAQALRKLAFRGGMVPDRDRFDDLCQHIVIEEAATGALVCCFRLLSLAGGADIAPLQMTYPTENPVIPIVLTAVGAAT